jgi:hypothetical protein
MLLQLETISSSGESGEALASFLASNSRLPGPRGNLELAAAFADLCASSGLTEDRWALLMKWAAMPSEETPYGGASEFLPFCGLQALGAVYPSADEAGRWRIEAALRAAANDIRWRVREGVAMGLQRIGEADFDAPRRILDGWADDPSLLVQRAVVAALAHPPFLGDARRTRYGLRVVDRVLLALLQADAPVCTSEGFRALRKGMEYAPSVFVAWLPEEGFALLETWAARDEPLSARIVRANAGKARLAKRFPDRVASLLASLETGQE